MRYSWDMSPARRQLPRRFPGWRVGIHRALAGGIAAVMFAAAAVATSPEPPVSFRRDIMQVLSKSGCNAGPCHGNANGKGGLKLSLRGEDPAADYRALVEDLAGRRLNRVRPDESLLLQKPATIVPHQGGERFTPQAPAYRRLREWIAAGAADDHDSAPVVTHLEVTPGAQVLIEPAQEVTIRAIAHFADGSQRDVSAEAVYETSNPFVQVTPEGRIRREQFGETVVLVRYLNQQQPVRIAFVPARLAYRPDSIAPVNYIDAHVFAKLRTFRLNPGRPVNDALFLRRAHLDLLGGLPTPAESRAFIADAAENKRPRLIERLLERPEFADFWALKWADLLRVEERTLDRKGLQVFHEWIRDCFAHNVALDVFARELIVARGSTYAHPAANFYRANRTPIDRALTVAQVFLGTRLNCAQCHNHPFDRWSQDDYHDWGAVFARVNYKMLRNDRRDENDTHEFKGEQIVYVAAQGELANPRTGRPAIPRLLGTMTPLGTSVADPDRFADLAAVARWLTAPTNQVFSCVQANRIWSSLMGRGLVDPVDDFRATNPASHPELLAALGADFAGHGFDVRYLIRTIMNSYAYQTDSTPPGAPDGDDDINYAHTVPRRLTAEQLLNAQHTVLGVPFADPRYPGVTNVIQLPGGSPLKSAGLTADESFLQVFGKPKRLLTCECERSVATTMGQALELISGPGLHRLITQPDNALTRWLAADGSGETAVRELYWSAVSRAPQPAELARLLPQLAAATQTAERQAILEDLAWALINSKEFVLRQ